MKRKIGALLCVFVLLFAVAACEQQKPESAKAPAVTKAKEGGGTLVFGRGGDSVGLDPAYETDGNSFMICDNIYEALVAYMDESTALEPGLAEALAERGITLEAMRTATAAERFNELVETGANVAGAFHLTC